RKRSSSTNDSLIDKIGDTIADHLKKKFQF
ncbi:MAG: hypothetical protein ACI86H_001923, partial [bacterium]